MRAWKKLSGSWDPVSAATLALFILCTLIGGASQHHAFRLTLLELTALPVFGFALLAAWDDGAWTKHRFGFLILAAIAAIPLVQLIPLPAALWTGLPGRDQAVLALQVVGVAPGWAPISLTPDQTWQAFLALLPPAAVFLGAIHLGTDARKTFVWCLVGLVVVGIALGVLQLVVGDPVYPWPNTRRGTVVGFFANRNHLATACLVALPFCAALAAIGTRRTRGGRALVWAASLITALIVVAIFAIKSRAGVILLAPALALSGLLLWLGSGRGRATPVMLGAAAGVGGALALVMAIGLAPVLARFDVGDTPESRFERWPIVADAAQAYLPTGAGLGSFDPVYRSVEPLTELDATYFNRAHNEYLETWLETGWLGAGVLIAFLIWFARRSWAAWRGPIVGSETDLRRASSIGILVILAHSAGDYPLRTVTIAATLAFCCVLLEGQRDASGTPRFKA